MYVSSAALAPQANLPMPVQFFQQGQPPTNIALSSLPNGAVPSRGWKQPVNFLHEGFGGEDLLQRRLAKKAGTHKSTAVGRDKKLGQEVAEAGLVLGLVAALSAGSLYVISKLSQRRAAPMFHLER